jgi:hypothetical protein
MKARSDKFGEDSKACKIARSMRLSIRNRIDFGFKNRNFFIGTEHKGMVSFRDF